MFKEETLFILGAGASYPYGYPLGKQLIENIIQDIKHTSIYLPMSRNFLVNHTLANSYSLTRPPASYWYDIDHVVEAFKSISPDLFDTIPKEVTENPFSLNGVNFMNISLEQIEEFANLKSALESFDPVSIDSFLNNHPSYALAGKIMIIYSLLKCENLSAFNLMPTTYNQPAPPPNNWYSYLIQDILSGCNKAEDIANNKLNILTFNYDQSLDYCLSKKLNSIELLKNNQGAQNYVNTLITKNIHHVYGKLYDYSQIDSYGAYLINKSKNYRAFDTKRFLRALNSASLIKLINEERESGDTAIYKALLQKAEKIIIIGFGFDRDNLNLLGFPDKLQNYSNLHSKNILYMDYDGKMKSLASQFEELKKEHNIRITRSTSISIVDAYQNDFKINLY